MIDRATRDEIVDTVVRLRAALDDLAVRGLASAGEADLALLGAAQGELERIGAAHLAGRLGDLVEGIRGGRAPSAPQPGVSPGSSLLRAETSLRLFERLLTREVATGELTAALAASGGES